MTTVTRERALELVLEDCDNVLSFLATTIDPQAERGDLVLTPSEQCGLASILRSVAHKMTRAYAENEFEGVNFEATDNAA